LTEPGIARVTELAATQARNGGSLVSFDVNLRHNLWESGSADRAAIAPLLDCCHILKVALEELDYLSRGEHEAFIRERLDNGVRLILLTDGGNPVRYFGDSFSGAVPPEPCEVVDTTAAGDAFSGGLLYGLADAGAHLSVLADPGEAERLVRFATACGAHAVQSEGAFPSLPTLSDVGEP
jgi:fructokinase